MISTESGEADGGGGIIKVSCPKCKAEQQDSGRPFATVCRNCGHYFKVNPAQPTGPGSFISRWLGLLRSGKSDSAGASPAGTLPASKPAIRPAYQVEPFYGTEDYIAAPEEPIFTSSAADAFVEALEFESADPEDLELVEVPGIGSDPMVAQSSSAVARPSGQGVGERMVRCLGCATELRVSKDASSILCRRCGCFINLEDFDIRGHRRENIRTRGKVVIHRRASLSANEVVCDSLKVYGKISGKVECSGDAMFRSSGKVVGAVRCRHIYIHKLSNIKFIPGIRAETAEIHGHVEGDIICEGTIQISKTGAVFGDCIAPAVKLEDGASLSGQMRFMKPDRELEEEYIRKAQAAQEAYFARELEADLEAFKNAASSDGRDGGAGLSGQEVA